MGKPAYCKLVCHSILIDVLVWDVHVHNVGELNISHHRSGKELVCAHLQTHLLRVQLGRMIAQPIFFCGEQPQLKYCTDGKNGSWITSNRQADMMAS